MIGRSYQQDMGWPQLDSQTQFGADSQYGDAVASPYALAPQYLLPQQHAPSEHNILNAVPPYMQVAQLAGMQSAPDLSSRISFNIVLPPGNQSLGSS